MTRHSKSHLSTVATMKRSVLLPILAVIVLLPAFLSITSFWTYQIQEQNKNYLPIERTLKQLDNQTEQSFQVLSMLLESLTRVESLSRAFLRLDREELLAEANDLNRVFRNKYHITHFYFHQVDRVNFLRVHNPERHGDTIGRQTILKAQAGGEAAHGIEMGPLGTLTLRVVLPWRHDDRLIGYLELGKEIDHIIRGIQEPVGVQLYTFINKRFLKQTGWQSGAEMLGYGADWNQFPDHVLMVPKETRLAIGLRDYVTTPQWQLSDPLATGIDGAGGEARNYRFFSLPLTDMRNRTVGRVVGVHKHDDYSYSVNLSLMVFIFATLVSILVVWVLFRLLTNLERRLRKSSTSLMNSEKTLKTAQKIAKMGSWRWDLRNDTLTWSDELYTLFQVQRGRVELHPESFTSYVCPDDHQKVRSMMERKRADPLIEYELHYRIDLPDGSQRTLFEQADLILDQEGNQLEMVGTVQDVTDKVQSERLIDHAIQSRTALTAFLETGMEPLSMERQLHVALDIVLTVPWLHFQNQGSIFLYDEAEKTLILIAHRNRPESHLTTCARIPLGDCLCGKAAKTRETVYSDGMDEHHTVRFDEQGGHIHYCLPLLNGDRLLGVANLFLKPGHEPSEETDAFLSTVGHTLAGLIELRQKEEALRQAQKQLKELAHTDMLTGLPNRL
ncbi:MAG: GAF domain-containing protein, partial [Magnetococcales bacterium]|nr:GAF domain-containing protein [Magnetococcales bacterium]